MRRAQGCPVRARSRELAMTLKNPQLVRRDGSLPKQNSKARLNAKADRVNTQMLLKMVLNNMTQGVLMFDADTRLIFCNQRYLDMYRLSSNLAKPDALSAISLTNGMKPARSEER